MTVVDPMCGGGTVPIEAALEFPGTCLNRFYAHSENRSYNMYIFTYIDEYACLHEKRACR